MNVDDQTPAAIVVWACAECGYWRKEKEGGSHMAENPKDPRGAWVRHMLMECDYIWCSDAS